MVIEILGKDKNIKSIDNSIQITLEMWDENVLTFDIDSSLAKEVKEDDIVLVDYRPISEKMPMPKYKIVKILKGKKGMKMWKSYKDFLRKRKPQTETGQKIVQRPVQQYIG